MNRLKFLPSFVLALFLAPPRQAFAAAKDLPQDPMPEQKRLLIDFDPLNMVNDR
ncbi:MAG: hypothetical protein IKX79_06060 [Desulfovibrionaceae bacterium]|nr:hypothetical protein [Desulfovibrionaceae bacterium]